MSIYASISGLDTDEPPGPAWTYQGSHILPAEDDPRGGVIGLALIPSHITRDARDDQPADGTPWPWLRMSIDDTDGHAAAVLNPALARHLAQQLTDWADSTQEQPGPHVHIGGNAEDCPGCAGTNPPYPFICPGPDQPEEP